MEEFIKQVMDLLAYLMNNGPAMLGAFVAVLSALIVLFQLVPGPQPEKFLQAVVDFLAKFSKK